MRKTDVSNHPLLANPSGQFAKAKAHTLSRALMCTAALTLLGQWSYGQSPAFQNMEFYKDFKGYSVEHADPSSGGGYVMAGTFLDPGYNAAHYIATDGAGNILNSSLIAAQNIDLIPVDIAVSNNGTYYITCQARRSPNGVLNRAFIRVYEVDFAGNVLNVLDIGTPTPPTFPPSTDLFATHSLVHNGLLYICGWSDNPGGSYPYNPSAGSGDKYGLVLCVDVMSGTYIGGATWNTSWSLFPTTPADFDMALRMRVAPTGTELLVTGATNGNIGSQTPSNVMIALLDLATFTPVWHNKFSNTGATTAENRYGIDAWQGTSGETYVLFNQDATSGKRWGVSLVSPTGTIATTLPNLHTYTGLNFWANQAFFMGGSPQDIKLAGQQVTNGANCSPPTYLASVANVNPFLADLTCSYNLGTGQLSTSLANHVTQTSIAGTQASGGADYLTANGFLGDVSRYYTFAAGEDPSLGISDYTLISPTRSPGGSGSVLGSKFNRVDNTGNQPACNMSHIDCPIGPERTKPVLGSGLTGFEHPSVLVVQTSASANALSFTQSACNSYYRGTADVVETNSGVDALVATVKALSPNPLVGNAVEVKFSGVVRAGATI